MTFQHLRWLYFVGRDRYHHRKTGGTEKFKEEILIKFNGLLLELNRVLLRIYELDMILLDLTDS